MSYKCIICGIEAPIGEGVRVGAGLYPSWRCADADACARSPWCGCGDHHPHAAGAVLCHVCDLPVRTP